MTTDARILTALRTAGAGWVSGADLSQTLGLSRDELMNAAPPQTEPPPSNARLRRKLRLVETFSKQDQKALLRIIDALACKHARTS